MSRHGAPYGCLQRLSLLRVLNCGCTAFASAPVDRSGERVFAGKRYPIIMYDQRDKSRFQCVDRGAVGSTLRTVLIIVQTVGYGKSGTESSVCHPVAFPQLLILVWVCCEHHTLIVIYDQLPVCFTRCFTMVFHRLGLRSQLLSANPCSTRLGEKSGQQQTVSFLVQYTDTTQGSE